MRDVSIDLNLLSKTYFYFDRPVDYKLDTHNSVSIVPISVKDSEIFMSSVGLLTIDKNSSSDPKIISMSYLQFIINLLFQNDAIYQRFINLLYLCLKIEKPKIILNEKGKPLLTEENKNFFIDGHQFEDIRRIILYQNLIHFDDEYINPELKQAMMEMDELKNKDIVIPSLERKIAIITAHTGLTKEYQLTMTYRSHSLLFEEVSGEVEFTTIRPIALFSGEGNKLEHWIYKKNKNKMDKYITTVENYSKSMGSNQNAIHSVSNSSIGDSYLNMFNNFNK